MSKRHRKKKLIKTPPRTPEGTSLRGLLIVTSSLLLLVSLLSFTHGVEKHHILGKMGETLGWASLALFGLSSYLFASFTLWIGWRLLFNKKINTPFAKGVAMGVAVSSLSMLLSLVEDQWIDVGSWLGNTFFPHLWGNKSHYHLGGAPYFYLYGDLPTLNFSRMLNTLGIALIFTVTFMGAALHLAKISPMVILHALASGWRQLVTWWKTPSVQRSAAPLIAKDPSRMVKVKTSDTPIRREKNHQDLIEITPESDLKERPSLSRKDRFPAPALTLSEPEPIVRPAPPPTPPRPISARERAIAAQRVFNGDFEGYIIPGTNMLTEPKKVDQKLLKKNLKQQAEVLEETLSSFGIEAKVGQINCGPTVTSFEVHPAIGVKVQKVKSLENDIALNMEAKSIRILAPIPGKAAIGIEVPNAHPQEVGFKDILRDYLDGKKKFFIPVLLGKTVSGEYVMNDLSKMPHCIIAGATGSGKSVCINTIVMSILMNCRPDEVKLIMVDPKKVELTPYTKLPHMLAPVITEPQGACTALHWLVKEMERRYEILKKMGVRNIAAFNSRTVDRELEASLGADIPEKMYYIVCIIDELADLMMVSSHDIETPIARIAQMARAVGIHMILATQRPSREVITGLIKANFPTRIAFKVSSRVNSQIILDEIGAESLLGNGDMLFLPLGSSHLQRAQGAYIRDEDINGVIKQICDQAPTNYIIDSFDEFSDPSLPDANSDEAPSDSMYQEAYALVTSTGNASTTFLQRKLKIGYARAASLMDELEQRGIVGVADGSRARKVLVHTNEEELEEAELILEDAE